jgi:LAGLIDADG endonuclease
VANLRTERYAGSQSSDLTDLPSYISGYVDGEGCFTVSISPRPTLRVGWEVRPSLSVSQNGDRDEVLLAIQDHFGCGTIRPDRSDKTVKWEVRSLPLLIDRVIPHFHRYPLRSGKSADFELFASTCGAMASGRHLESEGLREIVRWACAMNPSGTRRYAQETILGSLLR